MTDRSLNLHLSRPLLSALYGRAAVEGRNLHDVARAALARGLELESSGADAPGRQTATVDGGRDSHDPGTSL